MGGRYFISLRIPRWSSPGGLEVLDGKKGFRSFHEEKTMELKNFGSILNFAAELEAGDRGFYERAAKNPTCSSHRDVFENLIK